MTIYSFNQSQSYIIEFVGVAGNNLNNGIGVWVVGSTFEVQ
jgi:hypothetical protein